MNLSLSYSPSTLDDFIGALDALQARGLTVAPIVAPPASVAPLGALPATLPAQRPTLPASPGVKTPLELAYNRDGVNAEGVVYRRGQKFTITAKDAARVQWEGELRAIPFSMRQSAIATRLYMEGMPIDEVNALASESEAMGKESKKEEEEENYPPAREIPLEDVEEEDI